jgi:hypothetical protein
MSVLCCGSESEIEPPTSLLLHFLTPSPQPPSQPYISYLYGNVESVLKLKDKICHHGTTCFSNVLMFEKKKESILICDPEKCPQIWS